MCGSETSRISAPSERRCSSAASHRSRTPRSRSAGKYSRRPPDDEAAQRRIAAAAVVAGRAARAGRVVRIVPRDRLQRHRRVVHAAAEDPDLVERRGERDEPEAAHASIGRLHADHAAERGGLAHGPTGLRSERDRDDARGHRRRRTARRSSGDAVGRERIARRAERAVLGRRAHREFVHVRLCDDDRPGGAQARHHRRLERAHVSFQNPRPARRRERERGDVVLDDDRNAGQRADGTALGARLVTANLDQRGVGERRLAIEVQQRVEPFASQPGSGHPIQRAQNRIDRGESGLHRFAQRGRRITITRRRTHVSSSS